MIEVQISDAPLKLAADRAFRFLGSRQLQSGGFRTYLVPHESVGIAAIEDSSPFPAALIAHCLQATPSKEGQMILQQIYRFLANEMEPGGMWRYFASDHARHLESPLDLDDTTLAASVLRAAGMPVPLRRNTLLSNRASDGFFYTWVIPRWGNVLAPDSWIVAWSGLKQTSRLARFFATNEADPNDVDSVVNANVLYWLGSCDETRAVKRHLEAIVRNSCGTGPRDNWHHSVFNLFYFISKIHNAKIESFESVKDEIVLAILRAAKSDGQIGDHILDTALAAISMFNLGVQLPALERAAGFILNAQLPSGGWQRAPLYYGGPSKGCSFGSEELTTAFCLEALSRFQIEASR